jgi:hypothetical protein
MTFNLHIGTLADQHIKLKFFDISGKAKKIVKLLSEKLKINSNVVFSIITSDGYVRWQVIYIF